ncbi:phage late control D family protein [Haliangium sp.]|uniref:phage late control D family protein n=1 Tax=Haliangium sp. TaxID=2663208 RepID=UPI003D109D76
MPMVHLAVQTDGGRERVELGERLLGLSFEDSDEKTDKASLELDNFDLSFFDSKLVVKGALLSVSWGYPGRMAPERTLVVRRVRGFSRLRIEAHAKSVLLHREQRCRAFEHMTRSQVAQAIAREHGFDGAFVDIEDTAETFDCINQAGETDAALLTRLARREGFCFFVDESGLHWHKRRLGQAPVRVFRYYTDPAQGEVIDISIDNDVLAKPGRVAVRGRDPKRRVTVEGVGADAVTPRDTLGDVIEVVDPETGATALEQRSATASTHAGTATSVAQAEREAGARFCSSVERTVRLTMRAVGDPEQVAKRVVEIQGISAFLSGKYYVKTVKHTLGAGGYTMTLQCIKDGTGRQARRASSERVSAARPNESRAKGPDELRAVEVVDAETGRTAIEYLRE